VARGGDESLGRLISVVCPATSWTMEYVLSSFDYPPDLGVNDSASSIHNYFNCTTCVTSQGTHRHYL